MALAANEYRAACRGCHGGCVHILTVEDGKVVKVRPDPDAPLNKGRACTKGVSIIEQMYHPDRIIHPMKRTGPRGAGSWEPVSWDEAFDTIAEKLTAFRNEHGPESIAMLTGTGRHHMAHFWRFSHVLETPNGASSGPLVCLDPRVHSGRWTAGTYCSVDYFGEKKPAGILVWGSNPAISGADGELQWFVKDALKEGTPLIVVDPQPTELAQKAELWLKIRPGTDGALALGVLNVIISEKLYDKEFVENWCYGFDELKARCAGYDLNRVSEITWIPREQIIRAARRIASIKPISLEWGCAIEQSINSIQTCRALFILLGITGNYDVPGGFVEDQAVAPVADILMERLDEEAKAKCLSGGLPHLSKAPMAHPRAILKAMQTGDPYKIQALLVHANNSMLSLPDSRYVRESLKQLDFMVYMDFFMTPTAEMADIFLPAALWPELDEVFCMPEFSEAAVLCMQKVVQVGECKSDEEVFLELSRRMGLDYGAQSLEDIFKGQLEELGKRRPEFAGVSFDEFKEIGYIAPEREYYGYKKRGGFNTPSGKFELYSQTMEQIGGDPLPFWQDVTESPQSSPELTSEYPLVLTTGGRRHQYFISNNRQIKSLRKQWPFPLVTMHPDTAGVYGIEDGDWVFIETQRGRITQKAKLVPEMDPRVINCEMGWWYPEAGAPGYGWDESNVNLLTIGEGPYDPCFGSYQLRAMLCKISKNPSKAIEDRYYNSEYYQQLPIDDSSKCIVINPNHCILCGSCVETCKNTQTVEALEIVTRDGATFVTAKDASCMAESQCVGCGQCAASCPEHGIYVKPSIAAFEQSVADPDTLVVVQIAPSVRVGISEAFGFPNGSNAMPKLVSALYELGADIVHDTVFSADLTVVEEAREFLERLQNGGPIPLFTSCCPAWVRFCENRYPELARHISTTRSPQQMLGAVLREQYGAPEQIGDKKRVKIVSVMPCTAKKDELTRRESTTHGRQDMDISLTTQEITELLKDRGIDLKDCPDAKTEAPYGEGSGGGVIFGATGGVTEAVLRYLMPAFGKAEQRAIAGIGVRGSEGIKEFSLDYNGAGLKIAVASGLGNADRLMRRVKDGEHFDLIEVMACPGGCVMGGGQPYDVYERSKNLAARTEGLFETDERSKWRCSNENVQVRTALETIIAGQDHELLHRNFDR